MNLIKKLTFIATAIFILTTVSCSDDEIVLATYSDAVFVINEGNYQASNGSIDYYNQSSGEVEQSIVQNVNGLDLLGDVAQSVHVNNGLMFLVLNNSNKIEVVDAREANSVYTMTDLALPRYMTSYEGNGYVTEWVSFTTPGQVTIFDLMTGEVQQSITVGYGPEDIEIVDEKLYVANSFENTVSIISLSDFSVSTITASNGPGQMVVDSNNDIWLLCGGGYGEDFTPLNDGAIHKIETGLDQISYSTDLLTNYSPKVAIDPSGTTLYYYIGNSIYTFDTNTSTHSNGAIITVSNAVYLYGIGVHPSSGDIYVGDAKAFDAAGEVFRFDSDGTLLDSFDVGIGPNGFAFN